MRRFLVNASTGLLTLIALGGGTPLAAQEGGPTKIGYINSQAILRQMPAYVEAESTFSREMETYRAEVAKLQATFDSAAAEFEQSAVMLSPAQRSAKRDELTQQQQRLEQQAQELQERVTARQQELLDPIQQRLNTVVEEVRESGNYAVIFDVAAPGSGIIAADASLDLTDQVLARVRTANPGAASRPDTSSSD